MDRLTTALQRVSEGYSAPGTATQDSLGAESPIVVQPPAWTELPDFAELVDELPSPYEADADLNAFPWQRAANLLGFDLGPDSPAGNGLLAARSRILDDARRHEHPALLLASIEGDEASARAALAMTLWLAEAALGEVLLIDALPEACGLAARLEAAPRLSPERLMSDLAQGARPCQRWPEFPLRVLAIESQVAQQHDAIVIEHLLAQMKRHSQIIVVACGPADTLAASHWARACDGTYLLPTLGYTNVDRARQASAWLQSAGGRLWGALALDPAAI